MSIAVLYVDDEAVNLLGFEAQFRRRYTVYTTTAPEEALQILESRPVDVVLTDQRMGNQSGTDLLARVREQGHTAKRAIITGYGNDERIRAAVESGVAHAVFEKPYNPDQLAGFISPNVERQSGERA